MIRFLDGPVADQVLQLKRAPLFLRVAVDAGQVDALDQLDDVPRKNETLHAYKRQGRPGRIHVCCSPRSLSGWWMTAEYKFVADQPADETMRDNDAWREWATETTA